MTFEFQAGDILLFKRAEYNWFKWTWLTAYQLFKFFILRKGLLEIVDKYYHAAMAYNKFRIFTEEPPCAHLEPYPNAKLIVIRLKNKPTNFEYEFYDYCYRTYDYKFDYVKFAAHCLNSIFNTTWFTKHIKNSEKDICAENVSRFYEIIKIPCSGREADSTLPRHIKSYCADHPELFEIFEVF